MFPGGLTINDDCFKGLRATHRCCPGQTYGLVDLDDGVKMIGHDLVRFQCNPDHTMRDFLTHLFKNSSRIDIFHRVRSHC